MVTPPIVLLWDGAKSPMTDIHIHILPAVDDGSRSFEESMAMARIAVADGIHRMICTPHMDAGAGDVSSRISLLTERLSGLQQALKEEAVPLELSLGAEWMLCPELMDFVDEGRLHNTLLLYELNAFMPSQVAYDFVMGLSGCRHTFILAHPERYPWADETVVSQLKPLAEAGVFFQLTSGSLTGLFGNRPRRAAEKIARNFSECVVLATDAHRADARRPELSAGYEALDALRAGQAAKSKKTLDFLLSL